MQLCLAAEDWGGGGGQSFEAGATVALNTTGIKSAKKFSDQAADSKPQAAYTLKSSV